MAYPPPPAGQPVPMAPVPFPTVRPLSGGQKTGQFFGGLGLGLLGFAAIVLATILAVNLLGPVLDGSSGFIALLPIALFVGFIVVMALTLSNARVRWLGYGLLTALVSLPVIAVVGCVVILTLASRPA